ncbi:hypothetical protein HDU67_001264 [Dinochytrium kinnereticum]|nr:hypothetical protein HDU67_001264 [Dinochytrium kinnereticum]
MTLLKNLLFKSYNCLYFSSINIPDKHAAECTVEQGFLSIAAACGNWDSVALNLIQLCFLLIDSSHVTGSKKEEFRFISSKVAVLGANILVRILANQPSRIGAILEQILSRILANGAISPKLFGIIEKVIEQKPDIFSNHLNYFNEAITYLPSLQLENGGLLIETLLPLARNYDSIRNSILLTCRKGIFSKSMDARKLSCIAFLGMLRLSEQPEECGSQGSYWPSSEDCQILSTLRKALTQQLEVRSLVYIGLNNLMETHNWLAPAVMEIIGPHFLEYFESEISVRSPIRLDLCVNRAQDASSDLSPQYQENLISFARRLCECDLQDFDLHSDRGNNEGLDSQKFKLKLDLLLEIYDATILSLLTRLNNDERAAIDLAHKICIKKNNLSIKFKEVSKGKKAKRTASHEVTSVWHGKTSFYAFRSLLATHGFLGELSEELLKWFFYGIGKTLAVPRDELRNEKSRLPALYIDLLRLLLKECFAKHGKTRSKGQKSIQSLMVDSIRSILLAISDYMPNRLIDIIGSLLCDLKGVEHTTKCDSSQVLLDFFYLIRDLIHTFLHEDKNQKDALALTQSFEAVLKSVSVYVLPHSGESPFGSCEEIATWLADFCYNYDITDLSLAKHCTTSLMILIRWSFDTKKLVEFSKRIKADLGCVIDLSEEEKDDDVLAGLHTTMLGL